MYTSILYMYLMNKVKCPCTCKKSGCHISLCFKMWHLLVIWKPLCMLLSVLRFEDSFNLINHLLLTISCSQSKSKGDRAFSIAAPWLLNCLPLTACCQVFPIQDSPVLQLHLIALMTLKWLYLVCYSHLPIYFCFNPQNIYWYFK